jgi:hypothetical protein
MVGVCFPVGCPHCGAEGTNVLETHIVRGAVALVWCCKACGQEWPSTRGQQQTIERREGKPDRRKATRADRRGRESA